MLNLNDSNISTTSNAPQTLCRVVSNVVDMQQQLVLQLQTITTSLESLKLEHHSAVQGIREDMRRTDDRFQKQADELRNSHSKEVDRLLDMMNHLIVTRNAEPTQSAVPPRMTPQQQFMNAQSPSSFFGQMSGHNDSAATAMMMHQQQQQEMQRALMIMQQQALAQQAQMNRNLPTAHPIVPQRSAPAAAALPPVFHSSASAVSAVPAGSTATSAATPQVVSTSLVTPPRPTVGTVALPVSPVVQQSKTPSVVVAKNATKTQESSAANVKTEEAKSIFGFSLAGSPVGPKKEVSKVEDVKNWFSSPSIKQESTTVAAQDDGGADAEENPEDYVPDIVVQPAVPLPDLVDTKTGEEGWETLMDERCKLYRYVPVGETKEWKERGTGQLKMMTNPETGNKRVVVRRDQTLKVCANFNITADMTITVMKNDKALQWICLDFSEEPEGEMSALSARFKTPELATKFKNLFEEAVSNYSVSPKKDATKENKQRKDDKKKTVEKAPATELKETENKSDGEKKPEGKTAGFGDQFKKETDKKQDGEKKPEGKTAGFGDQFKLKSTEWECQGCCLHHPDSKTTCDVCGTNKDGTAGEKDIFKACQPTAPATTQQKFTFGLSAAAAAKDAPKTAVASPQSASTFSKGFGFGSPSTGSVFGGVAKNSNSPAVVTGTGPAASFSFASAAASPANATTSAGATSTTTTPLSSFKFNPTGSGANTSSTSSPFVTAAALAAKDEKTTPATTNSSASSNSKVFGSGFCTGSMSLTSTGSAGKSIFDKQSSSEKGELFKGLDASKPFAKLLTHKPKDSKQEGDEEEGDEVEEYEPQVDFKPVCDLPDEVAVVTGEEGWQVKFKARAKLFKYDSVLKENKERGLGDMKILLKDDKYRVVMRREQVHKVCANFIISPAIRLEPKNNMKNVYTYIVRDYSEGDEGEDGIFSVKFKTEEIGQEFFGVFSKAQKGGV